MQPEISVASVRSAPSTQFAARVFAGVLLTTVWLVSHHGLAHALLIGNPAPDSKQSELAPGVAVSDERLTGFLGYAPRDYGVIRGQVSMLDFGLNDGTEIGIGYRHGLEDTISVGNSAIRPGFLVMYLTSSLEDDVGFEVDYSVILLGVGGNYPAVDRLNVYGAVVYEHVEAEVAVRNPFAPGQKVKAEASDNNLGLSVGVEFALQPKILVGLELHPGLDNDDITAFAEFRF